ncbi:MAPK protein hog1, partial [Coemansia furcata]
PEAASKFDWSFNDADLPVEEWKVMMYNEILDFLHVFDGAAATDSQESNIDPLSAASTDTQATASSTGTQATGSSAGSRVTADGGSQAAGAAADEPLSAGTA